MANIMSLKNVRNKASRNGFDLSRRTCFTSKVGELLPVWWKYVLPGDSFSIDLSSFTRTQPVNTASYGRLMEYYDFFFVPLQQLWNRSHTVLTQMLDNNQHATGLNSNAKLNGDLPHLSSIVEFNNYCTAIDASAANKVNIFGLSRARLSSKLMSYLGYGQIGSNGKGLVSVSASGANVSLYPLLAYQKIYSDFYRYTQWESPNPSTFNVDWMTGNGDTAISSTQFTDFSQSTMFDLRYCNYQKDLFHGIMPQAQFGSTAAVPLNGTGAGTLDVTKESFDYFKTHDGYSTPEFASQDTSLSSYHIADEGDRPVYAPGATFTNGSPSWGTTPAIKYLGYKQLVTDVSLSGGSAAASSLSILALRQAEALQRWKEVAQAAEEDYKQQIQAHWNVNVSDLLSGQCRYLGGSSGNISINEVVNTNLVAGEMSQPADLAGKGIGSQTGQITFNSSGEYGVIMCVYHALPLLDYVTTGTDASLFHVQGSSFPVPEMDSLGMELLPFNAFTNGVMDSNPSKSWMGYVPRYIDWKTDYDRCVGAFASSLQSWILPYSDTSLWLAGASAAEEPETNPNVGNLNIVEYPFFKVRPSIVDPMFAVNADDTVETDHLLNQAFFKVYVTRNLDVNGLPY